MKTKESFVVFCGFLQEASMSDVQARGKQVREADKRGRHDVEGVLVCEGTQRLSKWSLF